MEEIKQPPIGLIPRWAWLEQRLDSINSACNRYKESNYAINPEWILEKGKIESELKEIYQTV